MPTEEWSGSWRWDGAQFVRVDPHDSVMSLETFREIAALAGLHVVTTAERKVLQAMATCKPGELHSAINGVTPTWVKEACEAELAKRQENSK